MVAPPPRGSPQPAPTANRKPSPLANIPNEPHLSMPRDGEGVLERWDWVASYGGKLNKYFSEDVRMFPEQH